MSSQSSPISWYWSDAVSTLYFIAWLAASSGKHSVVHSAAFVLRTNTMNLSLARHYFAADRVLTIIHQTLKSSRKRIEREVFLAWENLRSLRNPLDGYNM